MNSVHDFPSQQTELQQTFFQKSIQIDETNKKRKEQAQSDLDEQKRQSVNFLDFRLRQTALISISDAGGSTASLIVTLEKNTQQVANGLRERASDLYREKLARADICRSTIELNKKEQNLMSHWSEIDITRLKISVLNNENRDGSTSLEVCADQATKSRKKIMELQEPSQYGSGKLGRTVDEILGDVIKGMGGIIQFIFELLFADGIQEGFTRLLIAVAVVLVIAVGISDASEIPFWGVISIFIGFILSVGGVIGGLGFLTLDGERKKRKKMREEKREKLIAGSSAYSTYIRAENLMPGLYEEKVKQLDNQKGSSFQDAAKQENEMMLSITRFKAELEQAKRQFRLKLQKIESDYQREQEALKQEYQIIRAALAHYSKLAIATWNDVFWQQGVADALAQNRSKLRQRVGEIRIGSAVYPGGDQRKVKLPMLIDLERCGHIFILSGPDTAQQAKDLLKTIVARLAFAMPLFSAEFVFIDTEVNAVFADYQKLPGKMGGRVPYSFEDEIQKETRSLEQHQKKMQAKVGNGDLQTYNSTAEEPEVRRILCISGFPNPNRFRAEAQSHLENIIRSGARVGIHVVLNVDTEAASSNQHIQSIQELYFKYGVILQPLGNSGKWEVCFKEKTIPFFPDTPPDSILMEPIMQQIRTQYEEKPVHKPLQVFLCHASEDKELVREVYQKLRGEKWITPWLDAEVLLPGQDWDLEIREAIENSGAVIIFLSNHSVAKEGYVHREIKRIIDMAEEKPEGTIFIIPFRLDECELPRSLRKMHWVNYFPPEQREDALQHLLRALKVRYEQRSSK